MVSGTTFEVRPLAGALGAEVLGPDLSRPLAADQVAALRQTLLDHQVIAFRDQVLTPEQFIAFAEQFGALGRYPFVKGLPGHPEVIAVTKEAHETANFGGIWHSDTTYLAEPPLGSLLYALEVPSVGGDTLFANQTLAYEALSEGMRTLLDGLVAINRSDRAATALTRQGRIRDHPGAQAGQALIARHPAVRRHPETGRRALHVNRGHTAAFAGMTEAESAPLLEFLFDHQIRPEFTCRLRWQQGTLAFWDNRCCQHNPINDYHGQRRVMHRITLAGDRPR